MKKLLLLLISAIFFCGCSKPGIVEGVVTYFFNEYQGDKPDIGATVYATQAVTDDIEAFLHARSVNDMILSGEALIDSYLSGIAAYEDMLKSPYATKEMKDRYQENISEYREKIKKQEESIEGYTKLPEEKFDGLGSKAYKQFLSIEVEAETVSVTVDGSGRYNMVLPKGAHTVLFVSKGRQKTNILEVGGQLILRKVSVDSNSRQDISVNFNI